LNTPQDEIARYLQTGESDTLHLAWPGDSIIARGCNGNRAIRNALIAEVIKRTPHVKMPERFVNLNVAALAEQKIAPMVRGLFPADEQAVLMEMFSRSIVFLTPDNIATVIMKTSFASTAWNLANLYLLRVCPRSYLCLTEPSDHEADRCPAQECQPIFVQAFPIFCQSTAAIEPADGAFNDPTFGEDDELLCGIRALDDLHADLRKHLLDSGLELGALVAAVGI